MSDVIACEHHSVVFELFWHKNELPRHIKPGILALLKSITSELRHIVNVLSPGGLTWSIGMMSLFNIVHLTYLGSKSTRKAMNRNWSNQKANPALKTKTLRLDTHTSLKMSSNLLIPYADS